MKEIKLVLSILKTNIVVLWIPSHIDIAGNEEATMDQTGIPVAHHTVKARIKRWSMEHERVVEIYGKRRKPIMEVEKRWPRKVRTLYARLRTNHEKELKSYLKFRQKMKIYVKQGAEHQTQSNTCCVNFNRQQQQDRSTGRERRQWR